ncbi:GNAT family N-acetyltransferase [uncultured Salinisphaera sp.]|uniref:GNAT family N-acetyltransferase n=1 Tax=uncultured Salinisphaera sp. TaxID=359372 RepID=UPI0032B17851
MSDTPVLQARVIPGIGELAITPFDIERHVPTAHAWLRSDHARFWGMQSLDAQQVRDYFTELAASPDFDAFIGLHDDRPMFLMERYAPAAEAIGEHYEVEPGDVGMHVLVARAEQRIPGFTWAVFVQIMDFLFSDARVERVVVEPDVTNEAIHPINRRAGFVYHRQVELPGKTAWFASCTRADYAHALEDYLTKDFA